MGGATGCRPVGRWFESGPGSHLFLHFRTLRAGGDNSSQAARSRRILHMDQVGCRSVMIVVGPAAMDHVARAVPRAPSGHSFARMAAGGGACERERKVVVAGKSVSVRVDLGGRRIIQKTNNKHKNT